MSEFDEHLEAKLDEAAPAIAAAERVVTMTGAGISAESGVPTFRGPGGLWRNMRAEEVATPEAFQADPKFVWEFYNYRRNLLLEVEPNPGHYALAELERLVPDFTLVTQNVDGLHQQAGSCNVLEVHGNIWRVRCTECGRESDETGRKLDELPRCGRCNGLLRPAVVWFGEMLPPDVWQKAEAATSRCQVFLVVGTSAQVQPAAGLIWLAYDKGATVIEANVEPSAASGVVQIGLYGPAGKTLPLLIEKLKQYRAGRSGREDDQENGARGRM